MKKLGIVGTVALALGLTLTGCGTPGEQICATLPAPTADDLKVDNAGREVEITVPRDGSLFSSDTESELENGQWTYDAPDAKKGR